MKLVKDIAKVLWPIIEVQLMRLAKSTDTRFDDYALIAVSEFIEQWLNESEQEND